MSHARARAIRSIAALLLAAAVAASIRAQTISEFPIPTASSVPVDIASGPDGNLWFTESYLGKNIGRITPSGAVTEFPVGGAQGAIAAGPDGALWFTPVSRITTAGVVTSFPGVAGTDITAGPDGGLWVARTNRIARFLPSDPNTAVEYPTVLPVSNIFEIKAGPDGNVWFIENDHASNSARIARIDLTKLNGCSANPALCITEFAVPGNETAAGSTLASGPDGALWFINGPGGKVGRITTGGVITQFDVPASLYGGGSITGGPDGALWYTATNKIGRITTSGAVTEIATPSSYNSGKITAGPDGNIWFLEPQANKVGRVNLSGAPAPTPTPTGPPGGPTPTPPPHIPRGHVTPVAAPIPKANVPGRP